MTNPEKKHKKLQLTDVQKAFVVQRLACFDTPKETSEALTAEHNIKLAPQNCEAYDPTKRAGSRLAAKWRDLFQATRKEFLSNAESYVPIANKTVRLREMQKAYAAHKGRGNWIAACQVLEQVAKEVGDSFTNRREVTGKEGGPITFSDMTDEQLDARLVTLLTATRNDDAKD